MRTYKQTFNSLKIHLIDRLNPDIFISTWNSLGFWGDFEHKIGFMEDTPCIDVKEISQIFSPKRFIFDKYEDFEPLFIEKSKKFETNKIWYNRPKNVVSMYYKSFDAIRLKQQYEQENKFKYDLVIRTRPDILYHENIPAFLEIFDGSSFYILNMFTTNEGLGDLFFAGTTEDIDSFYNLYNDFDFLFNKGLRFCPHEYVKHYLEYKHLDYTTFKMNIDLYNTVGGYCKK
jgi:hypothetical protein